MVFLTIRFYLRMLEDIKKVVLNFKKCIYYKLKLFPLLNKEYLTALPIGMRKHYIQNL
jgi:hypothetical protein